jgi:predicted Zn-dependent protease with MMP-like domain
VRALSGARRRCEVVAVVEVGQQRGVGRLPCWAARRSPRRGRRLASLTRFLVDNGPVIDVEPEYFEEMVETALDRLPEEFARQMNNVAVMVEHEPGPPGLLGLYEGIPLTSRTTNYSLVLPDRITIYRLAICRICQTLDEVLNQVQRTVIHEIAHHFGIDDDRLDELGW